MSFEAPGESHRQQLERLHAAVHGAFEAARIPFEAFYDTQGFHIHKDGTQASKTFIQYDPEVPAAKWQGVSHVVWDEAHVANQAYDYAKPKNETPEQKEKREQDMLLGDITERVGYELLKGIFTPPVFEVVPANLFDDYRHGSDIYIIKKDPATGAVETVFGIDTTAAPEAFVLAKKMTRSFERSQQGWLGNGAFLQTTHNGVTQQFSTEQVVKLVLPLDEDTVLQYAALLAQQKPLPSDMQQAIVDSFTIQLQTHAHMARGNAKKVLQQARAGLPSVSSVPSDTTVPTQNLHLLQVLHTNGAVRGNLQRIARNMAQERRTIKAQNKEKPLHKRKAFSIAAFELAIKDAVAAYEPAEKNALANSDSAPERGVEDPYQKALRMIAVAEGRLQFVTKEAAALCARLDALEQRA